MRNNSQDNEPKYGIFLDKDQRLSVVKKRPNEEIFDLARRVIGCDWIEIVGLESSHAPECVLLVDEEGKLKSDRVYVNCVASYLYESYRHGDIITGSALLVKSGEESLRMLTRSEAAETVKELLALRKKAVLETVAGLSDRNRHVIVQKTAESIMEYLRKAPEQSHKSTKRSNEMER